MLFSKRWSMSWILCCLFLLVGFRSSFAQEAQPAPVQAAFVWGEQEIQRGEPVEAVLRLQIQEGWHIYWKNPGRMGLPMEIEWQLPEGWRIGQIDWSAPQFVHTEESGLDPVLFGYEKEALLLVTLYPPDSWAGIEKPHLQAQINWLACSDTSCWPGACVADADRSLPEHPKQVWDRAHEQIPSRYLVSAEEQGRGRLSLPLHIKDGDKVLGGEFFPDEGEKGVRVTAFDVDPEEHALAFIPHQAGVLTVRLRDGEGERVRAFALSLEQPLAINSTSDGMNSPSTPPLISSEFEGGLLFALILAFFGGVLLNCMPCVLPILSIKLISFVDMAKDGFKARSRHALFFTLGVLVSFWSLAAILLSLRAYGEMVGWGFQLQEPLFVALFACFLFVMGLNLLGVFEWGSGIAGWVGEQSHVSGASKQAEAFLNGVVATLVATPCTGPFLGSAVGFALGLPWIEALLVFSALGLGVAFPYLLLALFPAWLKWLPKPGMWMEVFKGWMGILLFTAVLWLLWVFTAQTNETALLALLAVLLGLGAAAWSYGLVGKLFLRGRAKIVVMGLSLLSFCGAMSGLVYSRVHWDVSMVVESPLAMSLDEMVAAKEEWLPFSAERLAALQERGVPVLVDFTAKWCLICQSNHLVLSSPEVKAKLQELGVVKMQADWTKKDPAITKALSLFGRSSVPLYVLCGKGVKQPPKILPQVLTADIVLQSLEQL